MLECELTLMHHGVNDSVTFLRIIMLHIFEQYDLNSASHEQLLQLIDQMIVQIRCQNHHMRGWLAKEGKLKNMSTELIEKVAIKMAIEIELDDPFSDLSKLTTFYCALDNLTESGLLTLKFKWLIPHFAEKGLQTLIVTTPGVMETYRQSGTRGAVVDICKPLRTFVSKGLVDPRFYPFLTEYLDRLLATEQFTNDPNDLNIMRLLRNTMNPRPAQPASPRVALQ